MLSVAESCPEIWRKNVPPELDANAPIWQALLRCTEILGSILAALYRPVKVSLHTSDVETLERHLRECFPAEKRHSSSSELLSFFESYAHLHLE